MALTWLKRLREPSGRLARWVLTLQRYNFVVRYRKGKANVVADALSRAPVSAFDTGVRHSREQSHQVDFGPSVSKRSKGAIPDGEVTFESTASGEDAYLVDPVKFTGIVFRREELLKAQQVDPFCQDNVDELKELSSQAERGGQPTGREQTAGIAVGTECRTQAGIAACTLYSCLLDADGVLLHYVPSEEAPQESFKVVIPRSLRKATLGYFHDSRSRTHHFKKWVQLFTLRKLTARTIWVKLTELFTGFGFPAELITDNASYFMAKVFVNAFAAFSIKHHKTTAYHLQANPTEWINRNLKPLLTAFVQQNRDCDACLNEIGFSLRSTVNRSTGNDFREEEAVTKPQGNRDKAGSKPRHRYNLRKRA
ncbi:uncharacterized protein LOC142765157 [Rhipicephalus microplus]|uniref:uncharacterized protein LOC142765157 n=1 Tax=Rhipicephalus microplus TaxID=6941 RepID=UPI003F6C213E